ISTELAKQLADHWEVEYVVSGPPGSLGLLIRRKKWVIRNDDLQLFDALLDGLYASTSVGFFAAAGAPKLALLAPIAAFVKGVLKVGRQAWTKGVPLDSRHFAVLYAIYSNDNGLTKSELLEELNSVKRESWTSKGVQKYLEELRSVPSRDGTPKQLVVQSPDGRWRTSSI
ncbi:MAG: hypothetical protein ACRD8U_12685, partial [Pyrinomonadaceae bacterium]